MTLPELVHPTGIAVEGSSIYVADHSLGHVVRIIDGSVKARLPGLDRPHHLSASGQHVLVTDTNHHSIVCTDSDLNRVWSRDRFGHHSLLRPHGVVYFRDNEFYVLSTDNHRLLFIANGTLRSVVRNTKNYPSTLPGEFSTPCGIALGPSAIYVADTFNHRVQAFSYDFRHLGSCGTFGHGFGEFAYPVAVATWHEWVLISDEHNHRLQLWRVSEGRGGFSWECIHDHVLADWLGSPFGLTFDTYGTLYVADRKDGKLLMVRFHELLREVFP
jgi:DNA-binding beta-propeller fold protein YncE